MTKSLQKRIAEIKRQMACALSEGKISVYIDLDKSLGIMLLNEK